MARTDTYGVYFIFKSMEQGPSFRVSVPKYATKRCYGASGEDKASSSLDTTDGDAPCRSRMT
jgi:hypothetical protein